MPATPIEVAGQWRPNPRTVQTEPGAEPFPVIRPA